MSRKNWKERIPVNGPVYTEFVRLYDLGAHIHDIARVLGIGTSLAEILRANARREGHGADRLRPRREIDEQVLALSQGDGMGGSPPPMWRIAEHLGVPFNEVKYARERLRRRGHDVPKATCLQLQPNPEIPNIEHRRCTLLAPMNYGGRRYDDVVFRKQKVLRIR